MSCWESQAYCPKPAVKLFTQANALVISNAAFVSSTDLAAQRFTHPLNESGGETLDRVHAAMLLQGSGRTNGLRALLKAEKERGPDFLRLANALSALYPKES